METTSTGYLTQDPGNLTPIPDLADNPEQLIRPDPAHRYRKGSFPLLQDYGVRLSLSKSWDPGSQWGWFRNKLWSLGFESRCELLSM